MSDSQAKLDRRQRQERRQADGGLPAGIHDRRVNIERRLFNLGLDCGKAWLNKPPTTGTWNAMPLAADLNSAGEQ